MNSNISIPSDLNFALREAGIFDDYKLPGRLEPHMNSSKFANWVYDGKMAEGSEVSGILNDVYKIKTDKKSWWTLKKPETKIRHDRLEYGNKHDDIIGIKILYVEDDKLRCIDPHNIKDKSVLEHDDMPLLEFIDTTIKYLENKGIDNIEVRTHPIVYGWDKEQSYVNTPFLKMNLNTKRIEIRGDTEDTIDKISEMLKNDRYIE